MYLKAAADLDDIMSTAYTTKYTTPTFTRTQVKPTGSALTIDVVVIDSTLTVHDSVTTTATYISTYTQSPSLTSSVPATRISDAQSSLASIVGEMSHNSSSTSSANSTVTQDDMTPSAHLTGGYTALIVVLILFLLGGIGICAWADRDITKKVWKRMFGCPQDRENNNNTGEFFDNSNSRSTSVDSAIELPTLSRSSPAQALDLECGLNEHEPQHYPLPASRPSSFGSSNSPSSLSTSSTHFVRSVHTPDSCESFARRWPFWPAGAASPLAPTRAENRMIVETLTDDYGINTARSVTVSPPGTVVSVNISGQGVNDNSVTIGGPALYRDLTARKPVPVVTEPSPSQTSRGPPSMYNNLRRSMESMTASVGGDTDSSTSDAGNYTHL